MPVATTTIRVPIETRNALTTIAHQKGVSVNKLLSDQVREWEIEEWARAERDRDRLHALSKEALAEQELWEATDDDWD